ncbi:hypothetical protein D9M71_664920 [compost metagenome]
MRNRQHRQLGIDRQCRTAAGEFADGAVGNACAFGENQHPDVVLEQLIAFLGDMLECCFRVVPVDGDRTEHGHGPAKERHVKQFALEHLAQW